jgi:hypothetical protein
MIALSARGQNNKLLDVSAINGAERGDINSLADRQISFIRNLYSEKIQVPKELINGKEYEPYFNRSKIKPLLFADKKRTASINTTTRRYNNITLHYDTYLDEVVYTDISRTVNFRFPQIALNKDMIEGFNLYFEDDSLIFKYLRLPEVASMNLKEGFYEIVYEGNTRFLIKHESTVYEREGLNNYKYSPKNFISSGGVFYKINNRKSLLRLCTGKSREMKTFLHSSRIKMRKADKSEIISILKYYDSLILSDRK